MNVVLTATAEARLKRTLLVLSRHCSESYLLRLRGEVARSMAWLADHPHGGQFEPVLESRGHGHRRIIAGPFKIVYRIVKDTIYVTDIFDPRKMKG